MITRIFKTVVTLLVVAFMSAGIVLAFMSYQPADAAPLAQEDERICITAEDGDDICASPSTWQKIYLEIQKMMGYDATAADAPSGTIPVATPAADIVDVVASEWTPELKCQWLRENFPQSTEGVQNLGVALAAKQGVSIPTQRVTTHIYHCDATNSVFDGLIILGSNEGFTGAVTLDVPVDGAVDAYDPTCGAVYSATPTLVNALPNKCDSTWRAISGTVKALRLTYWPFNDDNPPVLTGVVVPVATAAAPVQSTVVTTTTVSVEPAALECVNPTALATSNGWTNKGWADQTYGGLRVELTTAGELPELWEAQASGREIKQDTANREMVPGVWTIYPPYDCREELGFSR